MFLDYWMIAAVVIAFGVNSVVSRMFGVMAGAEGMLEMLHSEKIIDIDPVTKKVVPYVSNE